MVISTIQTDNDYFENKKQLRHNEQLDSLAISIDATDIATIFSLMLRETTRQLFENSLKYILGPIAALMNITRAVLAWLRVPLENKRKSSIFDAIVETVAAIAITTAVVGSLLYSTLFSIIAPAIFTAVVGGKSLIATGKAIYNTYQAYHANDLTDKQKYRHAAIVHTGLALATATIAIGISLSMLAHKIVLASLAIGGGAGVVMLAIYRGLQASRKESSYQRISDSESRVLGIDTEVEPKITIKNQLAHFFKSNPIPKSDRQEELNTEVKFATSISNGSQFFKNPQPTPLASNNEPALRRTQSNCNERQDDSPTASRIKL